MRYPIIYADPPWKYADRMSDHGGGADSHYETMTDKELLHLPVGPVLAAEDAVLFLWVTGPFQAFAHQLIHAWGFTYRTRAFLWVKLDKVQRCDPTPPVPGERLSYGQRMRTPFWGTGRWTHGNPEEVLLATRGTPWKYRVPGTGELIVSRRREHSAKPPETRGRINRLMGTWAGEPLPRLELFARDQAPGWDATGFGSDGKDVRTFMEEHRVANGVPGVQLTLGI